MKEMIYKSKREVEVLDSGKYKGFDYLILSLGTHPTAYVRIPKTHKYFKQEYENIDVDCHGGLTYSSEKVSQSDKKGWWIGWDYAHFGDYSGYDGFPNVTQDRKYYTSDVLYDVKEAIDQLDHPRDTDKETSKGRQPRGSLTYRGK